MWDALVSQPNGINHFSYASRGLLRVCLHSNRGHCLLTRTQDGSISISGQVSGMPHASQCVVLLRHASNQGGAGSSPKRHSESAETEAGPDSSSVKHSPCASLCCPVALCSSGVGAPDLLARHGELIHPQLALSWVCSLCFLARHALRAAVGGSAWPDIRALCLSSLSLLSRRRKLLIEAWTVGMDSPKESASKDRHKATQLRSAPSQASISFRPTCRRRHASGHPSDLRASKLCTALCMEDIFLRRIVSPTIVSGDPPSPSLVPVEPNPT